MDAAIAGGRSAAGTSPSATSSRSWSQPSLHQTRVVASRSTATRRCRLGCSGHSGQCEGPRPFCTEAWHKQRGPPQACCCKTPSGTGYRSGFWPISGSRRNFRQHLGSTCGFRDRTNPLLLSSKEGVCGCLKENKPEFVGWPSTPACRAVLRRILSSKVERVCRLPHTVSRPGAAFLGSTSNFRQHLRQHLSGDRGPVRGRVRHGERVREDDPD
jgi:hypothetical protein